MIEFVVKLSRSDRKGKKYVAVIRNRRTGKERLIHFGSSAHDQFRDNTGLGVYSHRDHLDTKRRARYYNRHSGVKTKQKALKIESRSGLITAKLLSHRYLW